jgi:phage tail protein X
VAFRLYRTRDEDMIDLIAWQHYGRSSGFVELILEVNRGDENRALSGQPVVLPRDVPMLLPEVQEGAPPIVNLWD